MLFGWRDPLGNTSLALGSLVMAKLTEVQNLHFRALLPKCIWHHRGMVTCLYCIVWQVFIENSPKVGQHLVSTLSNCKQRERMPRRRSVICCGSLVSKRLGRTQQGGQLFFFFWLRALFQPYHYTILQQHSFLWWQRAGSYYSDNSNAIWGMFNVQDSGGGVGRNHPTQFTHLTYTWIAPRENNQNLTIKPIMIE